MNIVDSSGWLEYFADASNADFFTPAIENLPKLVVPSITIYEVFKRIFQQRGESDALLAIATMQQGHVTDLDTTIALSAAKTSATLQLPMADSIILATTRAYNAVLWTQDSDFEGIEDVQYIKKG